MQDLSLTTMISEIVIYWDWDTCPSDRIDSVVHCIRQICVLRNKLREKRFVCFASKSMQSNERRLLSDLKIDSIGYREAVKRLYIEADIYLDVMDGQTSLIAITDDRKLIQRIINMKISTPIDLIYGNSVGIQSIELSQNVMGLPFTRFEKFSEDHHFLVQHFSKLTLSDQTSEVVNQTEV